MIICVAAAGNDSTTQKHYPSAYDIVIGVASSNQSDGRSSFSNYSSSWCEVAAPGQDILSAYDGNSYAWGDGTSMSTPHVAGMATLLYSKLGGVRTKANATLVRNAIQDTCIPRSWVKYGRVDLLAEAIGLVQFLKCLGHSEIERGRINRIHLRERFERSNHIFWALKYLGCLCHRHMPLGKQRIN